MSVTQRAFDELEAGGKRDGDDEETSDSSCSQHTNSILDGSGLETGLSAAPIQYHMMTH